MVPITLGFGVLLIALGMGFFFGTGSEHVTALIPAFLGLVFLILGLLSRREKLRVHTMHAAAALALLGCIAALVMGLPKTVTLLSGGEVLRPRQEV